jgi:hypothetical protein
MRISSGIAEINFNRLNADKIYVWPQYAEGQVGSIRNISRRTDPSFTYYKPLPEEREKIFDLYRRELNAGYSSAGRVMRSGPVIRPGSLFDAIA